MIKVNYLWNHVQLTNITEPCLAILNIGTEFGARVSFSLSLRGAHGRLPVEDGCKHVCFGMLDPFPGSKGAFFKGDSYHRYVKPSLPEQLERVLAVSANLQFNKLLLLLLILYVKRHGKKDQ